MGAGMKLKYYLRTLGLAIIVTTLLLRAASPKGGEPMSDAEIRERAMELGMVDSGSRMLSQLRQTEPSNEGESELEVQKPSNEGEGEPEVQEPLNEGEGEPEVQEPLNEGEGEPEAEEPSNEGEKEPTGEEPSDEGEPSEYVIITIKSGDTSVSVSRMLAEAGLVADSEEYDRYLCMGGYDKALSVGIYEIPRGSSEEEIAKIITKRR